MSFLDLAQPPLSPTCGLRLQEPFRLEREHFSSVSPALQGPELVSHGVPSPLSRVLTPQSCHNSEHQLFSVLYYTEDGIIYWSKLRALESDRAGTPFCYLLAV